MLLVRQQIWALLANTAMVQRRYNMYLHMVVFNLRESPNCHFVVGTNRAVCLCSAADKLLWYKQSQLCHFVKLSGLS